jgi:parallel beta-helix repeat protein
MVLFGASINTNLNIRAKSEYYLSSYSSNIIWVPDNYTTIQEAINAAIPGDIIQVHGGTYYETIFINKTISLIGEKPETTIIDGSKSNVTFDPTVYVYGEDAKGVRICNFTIQGSNAWGIYILFNATVDVENNIVTNNSGGIVADVSNSNTFINNTIINNNFEGILFFESSENTMINNTISVNAYNFGILGSYFNHSIDTSNLINGKPIYYLKNQSDLVINPYSFSEGIGYLALVNCRNITVENLNLTNNFNGLLLVGSENSTIRNNVFKNNSRGIDIVNSLNNTLRNNNITNCPSLGISLINSPNNKFRENNLAGNQINFKVEGESLSDFTQDIDVSNTVNGKVMRYLMNCANLIANPSTFSNTGYLAFVNCYNITAEDFSLENNELLVAFTLNSSIVENTITGGGIDIAYSSFINLTGNRIMNGESGISIYHSENNTLAENNIVQNRESGISLQASSNNTIFGNNIDGNDEGINLGESSNNTIFGNNITGNRNYGLVLWNSDYNRFFYNNFINDIPWQVVCSFWWHYNNIWDNGYPSGGNYWCDYNGTDLYGGLKQNETGGDGIGDTRYVSFFGVLDKYPLMQPIRTFPVGVWEGKASNIYIVSNFTVSNFKLNETAKTISFNVGGEETTTGFCRIVIPNVIVQNLWNNNYTVLLNGEIWPFRNWTDNTNTYMYFTYQHSEVIIIPEFPQSLVLFMIATLTAAIIYKRKQPYNCA